MMDNHANFAYSTVTGGTAVGGTSAGTIILQPGDGAVFPAVPFNIVVWAAGQQPLTSNAEVMRVTAKSSDTLTVTRAQESSTAKVFAVGFQVAAAITVKSLTDIEAAAAAALAAAAATSDGIAPASSPAATVRPGVGDLIVTWSEIVNADPVFYDIYVSTTSGFTPGPSTKVGTERGTLASIRYDGAGAQLVTGTTYYVKIIARDADGSAAAGTQGSAAPDPNPFDTDGFAPSSSPTPTLVGGPGFITASWTAILNPDEVIYDVYASTTNGFTPGPSTLIGSTGATELVISNLHGGTPLVSGTTYYIRIVARDADGSAAAGTQVSGITGQVVSSDVATDGVLPATPAAPSVSPGIGFITASWAPITNQSDPVQYRVYIDTTSGFTPGTGNLLATTGATSIAINKTGGPTPVALTYGQTYFVKIIAFDADGASGASLAGSAAPFQVNTPDIAANAITAGTIAAGAVTAAKISVTQLSAITSNVGTLTAGTINAAGVSVINLNASNITTGTLAAGRIAAGSLDAAVIGAGTIDAGIIDVINLDASNIVVGTLDAGLISVVNLDASSIVSGTISASEVTISAVGADGDRIDLGASGFSMTDQDGNVIVNLPTDGSSAIFSGTVVTDDLTVQGGLTIQGTTNFMDKGSQLVLNAQLSSPNTAPTLGFEYDLDAIDISGVTDCHGLDYTTVGGPGNTSTVWYTVLAAAGAYYLFEVDSTYETPRSIKVLNTSATLFIVGCAQIGGFVYVVTYSASTGIVTSRKYNISTFTLDSTATISTLWSGSKRADVNGLGLGAGTDGTYLMIVDWSASTANPKVARIDVSTMTLHDEFDLTGGITSSDTDFTLIGVTGRKSGEICMVGYEADGLTQVTTFQLFNATTHAKLTTDGNTWSPDAITSSGNSTIKAAAGVTYDGSTYHSIRRLHAEIIHYSNWVWTGGVSGNSWVVGYQWYDSVSGNHTQISPRVSLRLDGVSSLGRGGRSDQIAMRGQVRVTSSALPAGTTTTRVYMLLATAPAVTSLLLQSPTLNSSGGGLYTQYITSFASGAAYVDTNTFAAGTSDIMSAIGVLAARWQIGGDGTFVVPRLATTNRLASPQTGQIEWNDTRGGLEVFNGVFYQGIGGDPVIANFDIPSTPGNTSGSLNVTIPQLKVGDICFWIGTDSNSAFKINTNPQCTTNGQITVFYYNTDSGTPHAFLGHNHNFIIIRQS